MVKDIFAGDSSDPQDLTNVNGTLFFSADDGLNGRELWKSDGTPDGTVLININPNGSSSPVFLRNVNGTLFFQTEDTASLWKSDGTDEGTLLVKDPNVGGPLSPAGLTNVNGLLFFSGNIVSGRTSLWRSDGTATGTFIVSNAPNEPEFLTNVNGTVFFTAADNNNVFGLWKSDGTNPGTVLVKNFNLDRQSEPQNLTNVNGTLFFTADDGVNGDELWKVVDFSDDFNREDGSNLGPNWTPTVGKIGIGDNELLAGASGGTAVVNNFSSTDVQVQAHVSLLTTGVSRADLYARSNNNGTNAYAATLLSNDGVVTAKIRRLISGTSTPLATVTTNLPTGEATLRFEVKGSQLTLFVDGTRVATAIDTTWKSGQVVVSGTDFVSFDDFSVSALAPNIPFGDNFARANSTQLGSQWQELVGDMVVQNQQLVAKATDASLAVFRSASLADVAVQAQVKVTTPAGSGLLGKAGLVARYLGDGDSNYYMGAITGNNGVYMAKIFLNSGGTLMPLALQQIASGTGLLRFEVVGNSLNLFLNGVPIVKAIDSTLTRAGLVGVRSTSKGTFDTFNIDRLDPTVFTDSFDRPDSPHIGPAFTQTTGNFVISGNQLLATAPGINLALRDGILLKDVAVEAAVSVPVVQIMGLTTEAGLVARAQDSQNYYYAALEITAVSPTGLDLSVSIYKVVNGTKMRIGSAAPVNSNGAKLRFEVVGNLLSLYVDDILFVRVTDSTFTDAGLAGVRGSANAVFNDFVMAPGTAMAGRTP
jgi:ELWxxDGT repeat protein